MKLGGVIKLSAYHSSSCYFLLQCSLRRHELKSTCSSHQLRIVNSFLISAKSCVCVQHQFSHLFSYWCAAQPQHTPMSTCKRFKPLCTFIRASHVHMGRSLFQPGDESPTLEVDLQTEEDFLRGIQWRLCGLNSVCRSEYKSTAWPANACPKAFTDGAVVSSHSGCSLTLMTQSVVMTPHKKRWAGLKYSLGVCFTHIQYFLFKTHLFCFKGLKGSMICLFHFVVYWALQKAEMFEINAIICSRCF